MLQLNDQQLFLSSNENSNSIALMVKHLAGNMVSRWTDFKTTDGEKPNRNRDGEFENTIQNKTELLQIWNRGWACFFDAFDSISATELEDIIYIRNEEHTIQEALCRQLAHYPYHVGQIVYVAKMLKQTKWNSLSIPINKSKEYNIEKFETKKVRQTF